jgi:hypothetical protein
MTSAPQLGFVGIYSLDTTTYVGTPVFLQSTGFGYTYRVEGELSDGQVYGYNSGGFSVSITSGGGQLNFDPTNLPAGFSVTQVPDGLLVSEGSFDDKILVEPLGSTVLVYNEGEYLSGSPATNYVLDHLTYVNTSSDAPASAQISFQPIDIVPVTSLSGPYVAEGFSETVNLLTPPTGIACYRRGTLIEAASGQKNVEALQIGDKVRTASGALRPIKWIGRRSYNGRFVMGRKDILPVCIKSGALGENMPERDLWISPNHAMYFQGDYLSGVLIEAKDLVNGVSIVQAERVDTLEYFHIELDTHDVIIAEGALSETFIDDDSRAMFHNARDYDTLYAEEFAAPAHYCAPRLNEGYAVEAVRQRLALRAGLLRAADGTRVGGLRGYIDRVRASSIAGWAQSTDAPEAPVCLDIFADGKLIGQVLANSYRDEHKAAGLGSGRHAFTFTPPAGLVFASDAVEVRRSLDGAALSLSATAKRGRGLSAA